jgi:hypothetical protein
MWVPLSSTKCSPGVSGKSHRLQIPLLRTVTNLILIINFVLIGDVVLITAGLADKVHTYQRKNVTPFLFERRLKHGRGEGEKWSDDII